MIAAPRSDCQAVFLLVIVAFSDLGRTAARASSTAECAAGTSQPSSEARSSKRRDAAAKMEAMQVRLVASAPDGVAAPVDALESDLGRGGWIWADVVVDPTDADALIQLLAPLDVDALSIRDAVEDVDLPKVDDFGHHLVVVLHGLRDDRIGTYQVACFVTARHLITVRQSASPAIDALWSHVQTNADLAAGGVGELVARLADVLTRRFLSVLEAFDNGVDDLVAHALRADPNFLGNLTAVRTDLASVRRVLQPQRETLDLLRSSTSNLLDDASRRRLSDVFDVALRTTHGLDGARTALAEALDAYRGAEARAATEVTKVLTVYAAIMLPLSLIAGVFGMNFANLPGLGNDDGWIWVTAAMGVVALVSLGVFVAVGWIRRPSGRQAGSTLGLGLIEAAKAPAHIVGAVYEISTMPLRATTSFLGRADRSQDAPAEEP